MATQQTPAARDETLQLLVRADPLRRQGHQLVRTGGPRRRETFHPSRRALHIDIHLGDGLVRQYSAQFTGTSRSAT